MVLRPWQKELLVDLFALRPDGRRQFRRGLVGMPRKNGKSALGSGIALFGLFEELGAEVYCAAGEKEQARIVFAAAKATVEADPELSSVLTVYRDAIELPSRGSVLRVLSAEAYSKEGLNPSMVIFDEVHVQQTDELWNVMNLGSGTRKNPLVLGITTAGVKYGADGADSLCFRLFQRGMAINAGELVDPTFFFRWWGAPDGADFRDPEVWRAANPALGDYLYEEDFESVIQTTPENEFRVKRLNQWVASAQAWLPQGAWDSCADPGRRVSDGTEVILGFDGSISNDSTALVVWTVGQQPHGDVVKVWEKPQGDDEWTVPILEVEDAIRRACRRWQVLEVVCDPYRWTRTMQLLEDEGIPMVEFPQNASRLVPATQRFYEAVINHQLTHSGNATLARHVGNCTVHSSYQGSMVRKESKNSNRKIDLAMASIFAVDRAATPLTIIPRPRVINLNELDLD